MVRPAFMPNLGSSCEYAEQMVTSPARVAYITWQMTSRLVKRTQNLYFGELYLFLSWSVRR